MADKDLFEGLHATTRREAFSGMLEDFRSFSEDRTFKSFREFIKSSVNRFQDVGMVNLPAYAYESEIDARIYTIALEQVFNREFPVSKIQDKWQVWFGVEVEGKLNDPQVKAAVRKNADIIRDKYSTFLKLQKKTTPILNKQKEIIAEAKDVARGASGKSIGREFVGAR